MRFNTCQMLPTPICPALPGAAMKRAERLHRRCTRCLIYGRKSSRNDLATSSLRSSTRRRANLHPVVVSRQRVDRAFVEVDLRTVGEQLVRRSDGQTAGRADWLYKDLANDRTHARTDVRRHQQMCCHRRLTVTPSTAVADAALLSSSDIEYCVFKNSPATEYIKQNGLSRENSTFFPKKFM